MSKNIWVLLPLLFLSTSLWTQEEVGKNEAQELTKKLANPSDSLISVPLQNNIDFGIDPSQGIRNTLNIQPVVPISITAPGEVQTSLGDAVLSAFFSPITGGLIWGAGVYSRITEAF